jgi:hypothetical protein
MWTEPPSPRQSVLAGSASPTRYHHLGEECRDDSGAPPRSRAQPTPTEGRSVMSAKLFEAAAANFSPHSPAQVATGNQNRGPLLLITGGKDNTVPESVTRDPQAVPPFRGRHRHPGVRGPVTLADHRFRMARGRGRLPGLAAEAVTVNLGLAGKTAVVTGASRGIGRGSARPDPRGSPRGGGSAGKHRRPDRPRRRG